MKHGISLATAADIDLDAATVIEDQRIDLPMRLCFTMRGTVVRAIGLRKANRRERRRYAQTA
jgi:uncharacterized DUF497 family protein